MKNKIWHALLPVTHLFFLVAAHQKPGYQATGHSRGVVYRREKITQRREKGCVVRKGGAGLGTSLPELCFAAIALESCQSPKRWG